MFKLERFGKLLVFISGILLLALLVSACGGDDKKKDKNDSGGTSGSAAELSQEIATFKGALTFKLPADATFDGSQADAARFAQFTLKSGVRGYAAWGPLSTNLTPDADGLLSSFASSGTLSNSVKFEISGNPAAKAEADYSQSGMGYGYVLGVLANGQTVMVTFSAPNKATFDENKATILAIVDTVAVDGSKLTFSSGG